MTINPAILKRMMWPILGIGLSLVVAPHDARALDIVVTNITSTESSITFDANSDVPTSSTFKYCIGTSNGCTTPFVAPATFWVTFGALGTTPASFTIPGLKPGIGYTIQLALTDGFSVNHSENMLVYTQPGVQPTTSLATVLTPTSAQVQWLSSTSGTSEIRYDPNPPSWVEDTSVMNDGESITDISGRLDGSVFAVTNRGRIMKRIGGGWSTLYTLPGNFPLKAIDASHARYLVAVGPNNLGQATIYASADAGSTWAQITLSEPAFPQPEIHAIKVVATNQFIVGTEHEKVYSYAAGVWRTITPGGASIGQSLFSIATIDGKEIWAGGSTAKIFYTKDAGANWTVQTLPNQLGRSVLSVTTIDGMTIWAGGANGALQKYTTGTGWARITTITEPGNVTDVYAVRPDRIIFIQGQFVGKYQAGAPTYESGLAGQTSGDLNGLGVMNGVEYIVSDVTKVWRFGINQLPRVVDNVNTTSHDLSFTFAPGPARIYYSAETWNSPSRTWGMGIMGDFVLITDTSNPTITITQPASPPVYVNPSTATYRIQGNVGDNRAITSVMCGIYRETKFNATITPSTPLPIVGTNVSANWFYDVTVGPAEQPYRIDCDVSDGINTATATTTITYDRTPPSIDFSPTMWDRILNERPVNSLPLTVDGRVTDTTGLSRIEYQLNGAPAVSIPVPVASRTDWNFSFNIDTLTPGAPGVSTGNDLILRTFDLAGNVSNPIGGLVYYVEPTFDLTATPTGERNANLGETLTYTINVTPLNGFTGDVTLVSDNAFGLLGSLGASTVSPPYSPVTLTVNTSGGTTGVLSTLTITGTSGSKTDSVALPIRLRTAPNYTVSLTANDPMPNILAGAGGTYSIGLSANDTFNETVGLAISGLPAGVTAIFTRSAAPISNVALTPLASVSNIFLEINTTLATVPGNYTLVLTTSSPSTSAKNFNVALNISAIPDFDLDLGPASQTVTAGGASTMYNGTITAKNGFSGIVNLEFHDDPDPSIDNPNITLTPNTSVSVVMGVVTNFYLTARALSAIDCQTFPCTVTLTVTASRGGLSHTRPVNLVINEDITPPVISNISATPDTDRVTIAWDTDEPTSPDNVHLVKVIAPATTYDFGETTICAGTPCTHSLEYVGLESSTDYQFTVRSCDSAKRRNCTTATTFGDGSPLQFRTRTEPDGSPPTLTVDNPADSATPTTVVGNINLTGSASDNVLVDRVVVDAVGPGGRTFSGRHDCAAMACSFSITWILDESFPNGVYTLTFRAIDSSGLPSTNVIRTINVDNDFTKPQFSSGPDVEVSEGCRLNDRASCYAIIRWTTVKETTSQVDFGTTASCDVATSVCTYPNGPVYDVRAPTNPNFRTTVHEVRLDQDGGPGLEPNRIYHYQITTCNQNDICAY